MIEYNDHTLKEYKREKYGIFWRIKTFFIIVSPSAYSFWVGQKRLGKMMKESKS